MIDAGKLVPVVPSRAGRADRRREAGADHPGPRLATAAGGNGARGARRADRQPGTSCRSSTWLRGARAGRVDHRPCRGPALLPRLDSREAGADHPGPRVATAAVVPVVPIDGGKLVPIIDLAARSCPVADRRRERRARRAGAGNGRGRARGAGRADRRREGGAAPRQPGSWCRSSRATGGNGRGPVADDRRREAGAGARNGRRRAGRVDHRACRGPALLPIIDLAARSGPVADDRRREAGAGARNGRRRARGAESCRPCRSTAGSCCRSSRATGGNGARGARRADRQPGTSCRASTTGKLVPVVPIIQGHGWQRPPSCRPCRSTAGSWCRSSTWLRGPALLPIIDSRERRARAGARNGRGRARRADHRQPGTSCPCRRSQRPRSIIDLAARSGPVADRRREAGAGARNGRRRACGARRAGRADHRPGCGAAPHVSCWRLVRVRVRVRVRSGLRRASRFLLASRLRVRLRSRSLRFARFTFSDGVGRLGWFISFHGFKSLRFGWGDSSKI